MEEIYDEVVKSYHWVGTSNKVCSFTINIDEKKEVVVNQDGAFDVDADPDKVEYEGYSGNEGPTLQYWYNKAMIVIWPKMKGFSIACELGFSAFLDILESRLAEKDSDFITLLRETLAKCKRHGTRLSEHQDRLLSLCAMGGALEDVLCVLRLFSEPVHDAAQRASDFAVPTSVGIGNANSVATIAKAVQKHGWEQCGTDVMGLLQQPHVALQGKFFGQLALELEKLGFSDVALMVARRTLDWAFSASSSLGQLEAELVCVIFSLKECSEEWGVKFVNGLVDVDTPVLCSLVTKVCTFLSNDEHIVRQEFDRGDGVNCGLFTSLCEKLTRRDFHRPNGSKCYIVDLVQTFPLLGIEEHFNELIQAFVDQSQRYGEQHLLRTLLDADIVWEELSCSTMGKRGLQSLAEALIEQLAAKQKPVFDWCMPFAKFPRHPAVEEFLRGPESTLLFTGVDDFNHARNFARKYFSGVHRDGYSAKATAKAEGDGLEAYCTIRKTRRAFQSLVVLWEKEQEEVPRLRARIRNLQTTTAQGTEDRHKRVRRSDD